MSTDDGTTEGLVDRVDGLALMRRQLQCSKTHIIAHNAVYDLAILAAEDPTMLPLIFRAIDAGRVHCTMLRQMVIDNHYGKLKFEWDNEKKKWKKQNYSLAFLLWRFFKIPMTKGSGSWQLNYHKLDGVPIPQWPLSAREYAIDDSTTARALFVNQVEVIGEDAIPNWANIMGSAFALYLASIWGFRTDEEYTLELEKILLSEHKQWKEIAQEYRLVRKGKKESRNLKKIREVIVELSAKQGRKPFLTKKGMVATTREQINEILCPKCDGTFKSHLDKNSICDAEGIHLSLWAVSEVVRVEKQLSTYIKPIKMGFDLPIQCRYNAIIETYRTSCAAPNIQNWPRKGGIRDCAIARPGYVFAFCDYDTLEMRTLAQVCLDWFGFSDIAKAIEAGEDLHVSFAASILGLTYKECYTRYLAGDPEIETARQFCKIANYGFAGGMGAETLIEYAKNGYDLEISLGKAQELYYGFRKRWSEMPLYFQACSEMIDGDSKADYIQFERSDLTRGKVPYTAVCNGFFQHLAAMGAKEALWLVTKECFDPDSPLYRCHAWLFAHDEIGLEVPYADPVKASAAAQRLEVVMVAAMRKWVPGVTIEASTAMSRRWYKGAKAVKKAGILVPGKFNKEKRKWVPDNMAMAA